MSEKYAIILLEKSVKTYNKNSKSIVTLHVITWKLSNIYRVCLDKL